MQKEWHAGAEGGRGLRSWRGENARGLAFKE